MPEHDIGRFQVAMQNAAAMGVVDRVADVEEAAQQLPELDAPDHGLLVLARRFGLLPAGLVKSLDRGR